MKCINCQVSFTNTSDKNESNRYGKKYKVLTENLFDYLKNSKNSKNIKNYIHKNCVCIACFNEHYKNNTVQYIDPNDACYFCWNKKKVREKNNTLCCEKCQKYIAQIDEQGLINLVIDSIKSRNSKLFNSASTDFVYHNDSFYIDSEFKIDCVINQKLILSNSVIEFDSNNHSSYPYEEEKIRSMKTQQFFKEQNINCLYIRFGWNTGIDTDKLQKSLIILFDYLMLKLLYPVLYGFIIIGYPITCKRVLDYKKDWNLICSPFLATNKRPYLDWDYNDSLLNSYNLQKKIWDRLHVIYDNKKNIELFNNEEDRFLISTSFVSEFLNDGSINLEKTLLLKDKYFMYDTDKIVKIKNIEPFEQIGISCKKFKVLLEIFDVHKKMLSEKRIEYSYCDIKILKNKIDDFINHLNENDIVINNKYKIISFLSGKNENKIIVNDISQYETNMQLIFEKKLFSKKDTEIEKINNLCLDMEKINITNKRKRYVEYIEEQYKKTKESNSEHLQKLSAEPLPIKAGEWQGCVKDVNENTNTNINNLKKSYRLQFMEDIKKEYRDKITCIQCLKPQYKKKHNRDNTCCLYYL